MELCFDINHAIKASITLNKDFELFLKEFLSFKKPIVFHIASGDSSEEIDKKKFYKLEFMDNGIGIFDENKESIFQRGNKKDKKARGMGIGLSLVKKIIESYDGKIWVENRIKNNYEQGSNFIILIPELK